jgi:hypothetical protein
VNWRWLLGLVFVAGMGLVQAHEVSIEWEVVDGALAIRGLVGGEPAVGAAVEIQSARGRLLAAGVMDEAGRYDWPMVERGPITVVMRDRWGHRRAVTLSDAEMRGLVAGEAVDGGRMMSRGMRVFLGLTFLLALASGWMSYCNTRRLAALERRVGPYAS